MIEGRGGSHRGSAGSVNEWGTNKRMGPAGGLESGSGALVKRGRVTGTLGDRSWGRGR
jgi:hypothetical protein